MILVTSPPENIRSSGDDDSSSGDDDSRSEDDDSSDDDSSSGGPQPGQDRPAVTRSMANPPRYGTGRDGMDKPV
ncbi:hypothetical protein F2Q68_00027141 [Brassica cretica]|uniref:Uncharacterized protein n=1 Tax=Brassica cretica TaxID=69181 RepID=A0A8S9IH69_BRACR|nr:hypothetical protein F2Q68_00027141 [Brassica cretica]